MRFFFKFKYLFQSVVNKKVIKTHQYRHSYSYANNEMLKICEVKIAKKIRKGIVWLYFFG